MSVWRLPDVLVLHLKRFSQQNMVIRGKLDKFVRFPTRCVLVCVPHVCVNLWHAHCYILVPLPHSSATPPLPSLTPRGLDMSPYILGDARVCLKDASAPALFDLLAVVNHHGAANYGHYTAHVRPEHSENGGLCTLSESPSQHHTVRVTLTAPHCQSHPHSTTLSVTLTAPHCQSPSQHHTVSHPHSITLSESPSINF